uniref:DUF4283 domain-containing protein n=1 Tax=Bursaphelenchus xylophilus TaxID=6326 RepID=A0A1I7S679_BURXY
MPESVADPPTSSNGDSDSFKTADSDTSTLNGLEEEPKDKKYLENGRIQDFLKERSENPKENGQNGVKLDGIQSESLSNGASLDATNSHLSNGTKFSQSTESNHIENGLQQNGHQNGKSIEKSTSESKINGVNSAQKASDVEKGYDSDCRSISETVRSASIPATPAVPKSPSFPELLPSILSNLSHKFDGVECQLNPCPNLSVPPFNLSFSTIGTNLQLIPDDRNTKISENDGNLLGIYQGYRVISNTTPANGMRITLRNTNISNSYNWKPALKEVMAKKFQEPWELFCLEVVNDITQVHLLNHGTPTGRPFNVVHIWLFSVGKIVQDKGAKKDEKTEELVNGEEEKKKIVRKVKSTNPDGTPRKRVVKKKVVKKDPKETKEASEVVQEVAEDPSSVSYVVRLGQIPAQDGVSMAEEKEISPETVPNPEKSAISKVISNFSNKKFSPDLPIVNGTTDSATAKPETTIEKPTHKEPEPVLTTLNNILSTARPDQSREIGYQNGARPQQVTREDCRPNGHHFERKCSLDPILEESPLERTVSHIEKVLNTSSLIDKLPKDCRPMPSTTTFPLTRPTVMSPTLSMADPLSSATTITSELSTFKNGNRFSADPESDLSVADDLSFTSTLTMSEAPKIRVEKAKSTSVGESDVKVRGMADVPVIALQLVLSTLSYKELCHLRRVHPHWDELCGQLLNSGYFELIHKADILMQECQRRVTSEQRFARPLQVLTNLQVHVLNPVDMLRAAMDEGEINFLDLFKF